MSFCLLESDQKTFEYFKRYVEMLERKEESCLEIDNEIQGQEILRHLEANGLNRSDVNEKIRWIENYGKSFRDYLNTLKLAYVVWKSMGKPWTDIDWEDFVRIREGLNNLKSVCLDSIF